MAGHNKWSKIKHKKAITDTFVGVVLGVEDVQDILTNRV